jgi:hypothetical protein
MRVTVREYRRIFSILKSLEERVTTIESALRAAANANAKSNAGSYLRRVRQ